MDILEDLKWRGAINQETDEEGLRELLNEKEELSMTVNIYDSVNQVASDLPQTQQFMAVQNAFAALKQDQVAFSMYKEFSELQEVLRNAQLNGQQPKEEDVKKLQELAKKMNDMDAVKNLMAAEQSLNQLLNDINSIIIKPINDVYDLND